MSTASRPMLGGAGGKVFDCPRRTCEGSNDMFDAQRSFMFFFPGNLGQRGSMCKVQEMLVFPAFNRLEPIESPKLSLP